MINHSENKFIGAGGVSLYYQCWHPEQAPRGILVIVHGFGEHSGWFYYDGILRVAYRGYGDPTTQGYNVGFRCAVAP